MLPFLSRYNFFNPPQSKTSFRGEFGQRQPQLPDDDILSRIKQPDNIEGPFDRERSTEGPLTKKYREFVETEPPKSNEYKPSMARRLGAVGMGVIGGPKAGFNFLDAPLNKQLDERESRGRELGAGAKLESDRLDEQFNRFLDIGKLENQTTNTASQVANRESLAQRRTALTAIQDFRVKNPGYDIKIVPGGNIVGINRLDPSKTIDTGIKSGLMNEEDQINQEQTNAIARIEAQGSQARQTEGVRQEGRRELEGVKQQNREKIIDIKKQNPTYKAITPKGGNIMFYDPQDPSKVIDSGISTGTLTDEDKAELNNTSETTTRVSETDKSGNPTAITRTTKRTTAPKTLNDAAGKAVTMISPDGVEGTVPANRVEEAKKKGYRVK